MTRPRANIPEPIIKTVGTFQSFMSKRGLQMKKQKRRCFEVHEQLFFVQRLITVGGNDGEEDDCGKNYFEMNKGL